MSEKKVPYGLGGFVPDSPRGGDVPVQGKSDLLVNQAPSSEHYKGFAIEPIQYIEANGLGFHAGNVVKYVTRADKKGGLNDLEKARWYIDRMIELTK